MATIKKISSPQYELTLSEEELILIQGVLASTATDSPRALDVRQSVERAIDSVISPYAYDEFEIEGEIKVKI